MTIPTAPAVATAASPWAPLRTVAFRALWLAQLGSLVGTWMQTVGAQWLLVENANAAALVPLVQTASMVPVLLFALPAGVIADSFDRRRLMVVVNICLVVVGIVLSAMTAYGQMPPALLLTFTFVLGTGAALTMPAWQAIIPDLVPRSQLQAASALGAISMNLARAIGPAIAGVLVAQVSVTLVFLLNAASYAIMAVALGIWGPPTAISGDVPERFGAALRAGVRYTRHSTVVRRILLRSALYVVPGAALWALLPLVASDRLGMDAGGYGILLAALGAGAVAGALLLPRLRAHTSTGQVVGVSSAVYAAALIVLATVRSPVIVALVLIPTGAAWLAVLSSIGAAMQIFLPTWVRARGLSIYQIVFLGGQGIASVLWGLIAQASSLEVTFLIAAAMMIIGGATVVVWPLHEVAGLDRSTVTYWADPQLAFEPDLDEGPVLVTLDFTVAPQNVSAFLDAMERVRRSRQRTGATRWALYRDGADPRHFVEEYLVQSWQEHLRQHTQRMTGLDQQIEADAIALAEEPPTAAHLFPAKRD